MRALLWDLDGVIVESGHFHYLAYREVLSSVAIDLTEEVFRERFFGRRNDDILRDVLGGDAAEADVRRLAVEKEAAFRRLVAGRIRPLPGAAALLERAHREGLRQSIVSSTPLANVQMILGSLEVGRFLDAIVAEEDVKRGKPDPEGFLVAAKRLALPPPACVVLEDAPEGIAAGIAAGAQCIGIATTRPPERLAQADLVVSSLEDEQVAAFIFG